jgi:hypothetical protein
MLFMVFRITEAILETRAHSKEQVKAAIQRLPAIFSDESNFEIITDRLPGVLKVWLCVGYHGWQS